MAYSTITKPGLHFNTVIWSGDNTTPRNITGVGFQPDLIWGKCRNTAYNHKWYDSVRTFGDDKEISSSETTVQGGSNSNTYGYVSGTVSDGFTTTGSDNDYWNETGKTYVAWNWKANGSGSANTDGDINSTVSVNSTAGFSIVKYTGDGVTGRTVGHGLGAVPDMYITKNLDYAYNWGVYHKDLALDKGFFLNTSAAQSTGTGFRNSTAPTSTLFTLGGGSQPLRYTSNKSGDDYIGYFFKSVTGYSKIGSYTGNGSTDGTFCYTGFLPAWVMIKKVDGANHWLVFDNKRNVYNPNTNTLFPASSGVEDASASYNVVDFVSNGMKIRYSNPDINTSGGTYIYAAFAAEPLVANVGGSIPATAR